ncbi:MAG: c-type cytochrome [Myxococcota bacterium]|jgi:cytochrome c553
MLRSPLLAALVVSTAALAGPPAKKGDPKPDTRAETWPAYVEGEALAALKLKGDAKRGQEAYEVCVACHLASGAGRSDGTFPQLAGQHSSVIIKQVADIRSQLRENPVMHPFSKTLVNPQELADVAAFIATLPIPRDNQKGPGTDVAHGRKLYERDCASCHGQNGEGNAAKVYPVLAGQHYKYLLREAKNLRDGKRKNGNPDMLKVIKAYGDKDIDAIADYMSRLETPSHPQK